MFNGAAVICLPCWFSKLCLMVSFNWCLYVVYKASDTIESNWSRNQLLQVKCPLKLGLRYRWLFLIMCFAKALNVEW